MDRQATMAQGTVPVERDEPTECRRWRLTGRVQAVGFRPFVYRLARRHGLAGSVRNLGGEVVVLAAGSRAVLDRFGRELIECAPPLARPAVRECRRVPELPGQGFIILESGRAAQAQVHVPPDYFACDECVRELHDPGDRRYRYPFINCTQCGPRYTLIERLPYDRPNTTMAGFDLCPRCRREYEDPGDRRFHAQPVACPDCGPHLSFVQGGDAPVRETAAALAACIDALRSGCVAAVKGVGGYHLMCDARSEAAVARLRAYKPRPHKPLAVMYPWEEDLASLRTAVMLEQAHERLLRDPMRPVVLVPRREGAPLAGAIAPGLGEIGVLLPYSPLHHLLLEDFGGPLVATSGNVSGEPVLTDASEASVRLARVAQVFLHHDRPIRRPADDAVFRIIAGRPRPLRLGRGCAPLELELPWELRRPLLAVGGQMKDTVALAWDRRVVVSPHIGDLDAPRSLVVFEQVAADLQALYGVRAEAIACDAHPGYAATRWARRSGLAVRSVFHHHAHAAVLAGEYPQVDRWLVFTWDGVGYGEDGSLWGGEALVGGPGRWWRVASLRPFRLPGGDRAGREPWRSAAALCWEAGIPWKPPVDGVALLHAAWRRGVNAPPTSAVGRLFDAAASLTGVLHTASFEGQGPMYLEAMAEGPGRAIELPERCDEAGVQRADWAPLLAMLAHDARPAAARAADLHASLAALVCTQATRARDEYGVRDVGLAGGVFQNRLLAESCVAGLEARGFRVYLPERLPANDGGLCFGQAVEVAAEGAG